MKRTKVFVAVVAFLVSVLAGGMGMAFAGQFGPPEPAAKEGKAALGVGYFYYSAKFKPNDSGWEEIKSTQNQAYLQLGYGFTKNWEAYLRVGGADTKIKSVLDDPSITVSSKDFKDSYKPFGTIGVKGVFNVTPSFGIGPFLQASLYSSYKDEWTLNELGWSDQGYVEVKVKNPSEINFGIGLQGKIGKVIIYGGPVAYWTRSKAEISVANFDSGNAASISTTYKEKNNIGGFAGVRLPLGKNVNLEVEGQMKSKFSFGGALAYSF